MANNDFPAGLRPVGHLLGLDWSAGVRRCYIPSTDGTAVFVGDPVDLAGSADTTAEAPTVARATVGATNPIFGVCVGFEPDQDDLTLKHRVASTNRYALVCCDPFVIYEIQGCSGAAIGAASVGLNAVLIATHAGSAATGRSGIEMDSGATTAPASDSTYQLLILGAVPRPDNDISVVNAKWHVLITLHRLLPNYSPTDAAYFGAKGV